MTAGIEEIPGPRPLPLVGNVFDLDPRDPFESLTAMAREYGGLFRMVLPGGGSRLVASTFDVVDEVCDDTRFDKSVGGGLRNLRDGPVGAGLFTADTADPLWHRAHNILLSPFSLQNMHEYLPLMQDVADQLVGKWERLNPDDDVDVPADMTRLTLDTIALCGFGYRFNSFYRENQHPFVDAMVRTLAEAQAAPRRLPGTGWLHARAVRQYEDDGRYMANLVDGLIRERRAQGAAGETRDMLGRMINGVDPRTGEGLPDENIRAQCITFLIAGHETTSGLLSFAVHYLMTRPDVLARARAEVDEVLGGALAPTYEQLHRLTYLDQVLAETLRLWPTAPGFTRTPLEDTVLGGYAVPAGTPVTVLSGMLHRDRSVWGEDAEEFEPDHFAPERRAQLPANAYKPFGTGQRACIGRVFAMQEAVLVLAMLVQRFEFVDAHGYRLRTKTTLTIKPDGMLVRIRRRGDAPVYRAPVAPEPERAERAAGIVAPVHRHGTPLAVLHGSNLGACEAIAAKLAQEGTERGYDVAQGSLDEFAGKLPADGATVVVCSSYNGTPPDNAAGFCAWLAAAASDACAGASFTVFGCGNTEWAATYQAVPQLLDAQLEAHGARRVHPRGEGDQRGDFDAHYRAWHEGLWAALAGALELPATAVEPAASGPRLTITTVNRQLTNPVITSYAASPALVRENRELVTGDGSGPARSTRHVAVALPAGTTYRAGDHLGVLPRNGVDLIRRALARFTLDAGTYVTIVPNRGSHTHLPVDEPVPLLAVLGSCVELQDVASRADIEVLAAHTADEAQRAALERLATDDTEYRARVFTPHRSLLDLLEEHPACTLPFEEYLDMLPPLRPRYYSISSSPLVDAGVATITTGVLAGPVRGGAGTFHGVCSTHVAGLAPGSTVFVFVREPSIPFRPPADTSVPMIMVGAGTGLAPFRGFLEERAAQQAAGRSLLFFGCRDPERDQLYADELAAFEEAGTVTVRTVFSGRPEDGRRYVQHEMAHRGDEVWALLEQGAHLYVCGNANTIAPGARAVLADLWRERTGGSAEDAQLWLAELRASGRFVEDVWGG